MLVSELCLATVVSVRVQELGVEISQLLVSTLVHEMCLEYARRLVDV